MRILVVDDEEQVRDFLRYSLESRGHDVAEVESGEACIERLQGRKPDLLLLDLSMTGIDGLETAEAARAAGFSGPILLFSGYLTPEVHDRAKEAGILPISKIDTGALLRVVDALDGQVTDYKTGAIAGA